MQIKVPCKLSLEHALNFCNNLWELDHSDEYNFDFKHLNFIEPFTMAYVANEIKRFRKTKPNSKFTVSNHEDKSYAAHMGFFKAFGLNYGKEPGEAAGNSRYLPLTKLSIDELQNEAYEAYDDIGNIIESKSRNIAELLTQETNGELVDVLTYSIREIFRNVVEHSGSEVIEYCGQYWPTKKLVELAVLDTGTGIMKGLSSNPYLDIKSENDALNLALLPGISGKMYKGVKKKKNDVWQNSGFGLYMTSRICRDGGDFFIVSNDSSLFLDSASKNKLKCNYKGVALRLRINISNVSTCSDMLNKYRTEGYDIAKKNGQAIIEPSVASMMLAKDFSKD